MRRAIILCVQWGRRWPDCGVSASTHGGGERVCAFVRGRDLDSGELEAGAAVQVGAAIGAGCGIDTVGVAVCEIRAGPAGIAGVAFTFPFLSRRYDRCWAPQLAMDTEPTDGPVRISVEDRIPDRELCGVQAGDSSIAGRPVAGWCGGGAIGMRSIRRILTRRSSCNPESTVCDRGSGLPRRMSSGARAAPA